MNVVKEIGKINQLQLGLAENASWHDQYKDSAYVFAGGLDVDLTEGDVITIFSQYGEVADINMPRDKTTNKARGFAFLMYEDQRSTVLAVDNLNGAKVLERTLRVDHVDKYKQLEKGEDGKFKERETQSLNAVPENFTGKAGEQSDSEASSHPSIDPDDPMAAYLLEQAREQKRSGKGKKKSKRIDGESREERKERKKQKKRLKELEAKERATGKSQPSSSRFESRDGLKEPPRDRQYSDDRQRRPRSRSRSRSRSPRMRDRSDRGEKTEDHRQSTRPDVREGRDYRERKRRYSGDEDVPRREDSDSRRREDDRDYSKREDSQRRDTRDDRHSRGHY